MTLDFRRHARYSCVLSPRRLQLVEGHGYSQLTDELKAKVFGLYAARIRNLKTTARAVPAEQPRIVAV